MMQKLVAWAKVGYSKGESGILCLLRKLFRLKDVSDQEELYPLQIMLERNVLNQFPLHHF